MNEKYILAHDLGTTGDKASLYDSQGNVLGSVFSGYGTQYPQVNWVEQSPEDWWQAVCISTNQLISSSGVSPKSIACIAFSGQMMGCVAVDKEARPLRKAIIWADQRGVQETNTIIDKVGMENTYRITGHRASPSYSGAKILWVRNHEPELYRETHKFLHAKDFIVARLTGNFVTDFSDAGGMNLFDLVGKDWSGSILEAINLEREKLPQLHASTDIVGEVKSRVAEEVGLLAGTPVVIGGGDGCCAAVGAGVVRAGSAYNYIGSSAWIGIASKEPIFDPGLRTFNWVHLVPGMYHPTGSMQAAGASYQWLRDVFCQPEIRMAAEQKLSPYDLMNQLAEKSPPGANNLLFLPYLMGERSPRWNPKARGAYFGLTVKHTREDFIRATLEGITYNLRVILEAFEEQGAQVNAMRVIGGGARGEIWRQILADIYNKPVQRLQLVEEATSLGAALAGGIGVGIFKDFMIAEQLTPIYDQVLPNPDVKSTYDRLFGFFNRAYEAFVPLYDELALTN